MNTQTRNFNIGLGLTAVAAIISATVFFKQHIAPTTTVENSQTPAVSSQRSAQVVGTYAMVATQTHHQTRPALGEIPGRFTREVEQARQALTQIQNEMQAMRTGPSFTGDGALAQPTPEQMLDISTRKAQAQERLFEESFAAEEADPQWSLEAKEQLTTRLQGAGQIQVGKLECASTMCQLSAQTASSADPTSIYRSLQENLAWEGEMYVSMNQETGAMTAYFSRPGNSLPRAASQ